MLKKDQFFKEYKTHILISVTVFVLIFAFPVFYWTSAEKVVIKIDNKDREIKGSGQTATGKYIIYAPNEVYECTDTWLFWRFDSSDVYADLDKGATYEATVAGWRIPFLSWYRNIIEVEELREDPLKILKDKYRTPGDIEKYPKEEVFEDIQLLLNR